MYWILTNLQEMANDAEREYVIEQFTITVLIPVITHMLSNFQW